ncbi:MAG: transposase, partial [Thermoleophilia bacterium]
MRSARLWARLLGVEQAVVERVCLDEDEQALVVSVRPRKGTTRRCGRCGRRCPGFDQGEGRRRWRALDLGVVRAYLEAEAPRVCCPEHGVVVAAVPWARHGAGHTRAFDDTAAWLAVHTSKQAVRELLRVAWATVGRIITRVVADAEASRDRLAGLRRIGIDEISHRKGQRYLTVVVDHDTGRLVWAASGRDRKTVERFLDELGETRCKQIKLVSCDMASWIAGPVADRLPDAVRCVDPFHVVMVRHEALSVRAGCKTSPVGCRGSPEKWGSLIPELRVRARAVLT